MNQQKNKEIFTFQKLEHKLSQKVCPQDKGINRRNRIPRK